MTETTQRVTEHYARGNLGAAILAALRGAGIDPDALSPADLVPLDQFHAGGLVATVQLAELAGVDAGGHLLDVGCGIGGPARHLAAEFGCRVTGIDLTEEYCRVAAMLAARTGLSGLVDYRHGDALTMPFADASFDPVWTQHASMNIADKDGLLAEMHRVLKPGGRLALYDILAGPGGPPHFTRALGARAGNQLPGFAGGLARALGGTRPRHPGLARRHGTSDRLGPDHARPGRRARPAGTRPAPDHGPRLGRDVRQRCPQPGRGPDRALSGGRAEGVTSKRAATLNGPRLAAERKRGKSCRTDLG